MRWTWKRQVRTSLTWRTVFDVEGAWREPVGPLRLLAPDYFRVG